MMEAATPASADGWKDVDTVNFGRLFSLAMMHKWVIVGTFVATIVAAIVFLNVAKYKYTVEYQVTPTDSTGGSLLGGLGGLASLAGVNLPGKSDASPFGLYLENLQNRSVAAQISHDAAIMHGAFPTQWDPVLKRWHKPDSVISGVSNGVRSALGIPVYGWKPPGPAELQKFIKDNVTIAEVPKKSIGYVTIDHEDPVFAARLLAAMHEASDAELRRRALARSTAYIDYIGRQLPLVTIAEQRAALAKALSDQEKQRMMASADVPFAADLFSPISASPRPTTPKPVLVLAVAAGLGLVLGFAIALCITLFRKPRAARF